MKVRNKVRHCAPEREKDTSERREEPDLEKRGCEAEAPRLTYRVGEEWSGEEQARSAPSPV